MTIVEWARNEPHQKDLQSFLSSDCGKSVVSVLGKMARPIKVGESPNLEALALDHQYIAGFQACIQALSNLPATTYENLNVLEKAQKLTTEQSWKHVARSKNPPAKQ